VTATAPASGVPALAAAPAALVQARVLVADDEPANVRLLEMLLGAAGYRNVASAADGRAAVELWRETTPDVVLLDLHMPKMDGVKVLEEMVTTEPGRAHVPVIVLTADTTRGAMERVLAAGATDFLTKPLDTLEVLLRIRNHLQVRFLHTQMDRLVRERTAQLESAQHEMLARLAQAAEFRDDQTGHHTRRVARLSAVLASALGLPPAACDAIEAASPLHDVGKIGIPDAILLKPSALTEAEFAVMMRHTSIGARLLEEGTSEVLRLALRIAQSHHERWDGTGYPTGLAGEEIPLEARIVAVADFYDAVTHDRPYRAAWSPERALEMLEKEAGRHFDPVVVRALLELPRAGLPA
jgi:putative two-component system response regulator